MKDAECAWTNEKLIFRIYIFPVIVKINWKLGWFLVQNDQKSEKSAIRFFIRFRWFRMFHGSSTNFEKKKKCILMFAYRTLKPVLAKYAVDANLFRLGSTKTKKKFPNPGCFLVGGQKPHRQKPQRQKCQEMKVPKSQVRLGFVSWWFCLWGFCPWGFCPWDFCPWGFRPEISTSTSREPPRLRLESHRQRSELLICNNLAGKILTWFWNNIVFKEK